MSMIQESITSILHERNNRKHLALVVSMIAVATALAVIWALHINGITLSSGDLVCGMEEHTHTSDCYAWVPVEGGTEECTEPEETEEGIEPEETETASEVEETQIVSDTELSANTENDIETEDGTVAAGEVDRNSSEIADETASGIQTESTLSGMGTESVGNGTESVEIGTESVTEDGTEALTEEETESPQVGDTKIVNGVEYVYSLICGMEEHTHTEECYASDDTEETEAEEVTAESVSLTAGVASVGTARLGSAGTTPSAGVSAVAEEDDGNSGIATVSEESGTELTATAADVDTTEYYLANTVSGVPADGSYIIYTYDRTNEIYYVVNNNGSLTACTIISSITEATGAGPYYVSSTGTIVYGTDGASAYEAAQWTVAQDSSDSNAYTITDSSSSSYYFAATETSDELTVSGNLSNTYRTGEITLTGDFELTYTFYDKSSGSDNWDNFVLEMVGNGVYLDVRADNYGWTTKDTTNNKLLTFGNGLSEDEWPTWKAAMQSGQLCTVTVTRTGASIEVTTMANGVTFTASATVSEYNNASLTVYLTGQNCTLSDVLYSYKYTTSSSINSNLDSSATTLVSTDPGYVTFTNDASSGGVTISRENISAVQTGASAAWEAYGTASVFYFVQVQTTADNYHFTDAVTLTEAAKNQDESYVVYTQIDGTYYIVSAVDGSLLECTDISSSSYSEDDKVLLSAGIGVYIWSFDSSSGEPVFKFTTGTDDNDVDYFEDYRWTISSSNYGTDGDGTYTLYNEENDDYLAPQLDVVTKTLERTNGSYVSSDEVTLNGYGTFEYTLVLDAAYSSSGVNYANIRTYVYNNGKNSGRYIYVITPNVPVGTDWSEGSFSLGNNGYGNAVGYGIGSFALNVGDEIVITIVTANNVICFNYYNKTTDQIYVYIVNLNLTTDNTSDNNFSVGSRVFMQNINGNYTLSSVTYGQNSSYGVSNSISSGGSTSLDDGSLSVISDSVMTLSGDFDITYSFTNVSNTAALASGATETEITAAAEDNFAIELTDGTNTIYVRANNEGWITTDVSGTVSTSSTFYTYGDSAVDWSTFVAAMRSGATCTARVIRTGNNFVFILAVTPTNSATYPDTYTFTTSVTASEFTEGSTVYAYLAGENCTISSATYTNNTARERNDTEYRRISYVTKEIEIASTTDSYAWEVSVTGYYLENFVLISQIAADSVATAEIEWVDKDSASAGDTTTGSATTTLGGESTATLSNTVVVTLSLARVREYTAWFDGTNGGMTTNNSTDTPIVSSSNATGTKFTVTAPTATSPTYISYDLRGWYDIYTSTYYEPGETFEITDHTVLYADWKVASYDIGQNNSYTVDSVSTDSFTDIYLFDFGDDYDKIALN